MLNCHTEKKKVNQWYKFPCPKHFVSKKKAKQKLELLLKNIYKLIIDK